MIELDYFSADDVARAAQFLVELTKQGAIYTARPIKGGTVLAVTITGY